MPFQWSDNPLGTTSSTPNGNYTPDANARAQEQASEAIAKLMQAGPAFTTTSIAAAQNAPDKEFIADAMSGIR